MVSPELYQELGMVSPELYPELRQELGMVSPELMRLFL